jgi:uncharacterized membrane protein
MSELSGPGAAALAIALMALATFLCRISGVAAMNRIRLTPRIERALQAIPGCIVTATVLPIGLQSGPAGMAGLAAALAAMAATRHEVVALGAGLTTIALARAAGF